MEVLKKNKYIIAAIFLFIIYIITIVRLINNKCKPMLPLYPFLFLMSGHSIHPLFLRQMMMNPMVRLFPILGYNKFFSLYPYNAPKVKKYDYSVTFYGKKLIDPYYWLKDDKWPTEIENKNILQAIQNENNFFKTFTYIYNEQINMIAKEILNYQDIDDCSEYIKFGDFYYYSIRERGKSYSKHCRKKTLDSEGEIILDINKIAEGKEYLYVKHVAVSYDHNYIAYSADFIGNEKFSIYIHDIKTQTSLPNVISNTTGKIVWHPKKHNYLYYISLIKPHITDKVMYHNINSDCLYDISIFNEKNNDSYTLNIYISSSKKFLFIYRNGHKNNEAYYIYLETFIKTINLFQKMEENIFYVLLDVKDNFMYFLTSQKHSGKQNCIMRKKLNSNYSLNEEDSSIFIDCEDNKPLHSAEMTSNFILLNYKIRGLDYIFLYDLQNNVTTEINFNKDASYTLHLYSTNFYEDDIRVEYSSLRCPTSKYIYDYQENTFNKIYQYNMPSSFNQDDYNIEYVHATSDGVEVPITIIYKNNLFYKNGSNPLYLTGYGSYGISYCTNFSTTIIPLLDKGFVYAIAHIRGGSDIDEKWYLDAKLLHKKRTFYDFIASTEYLIENKYTSKNNIVISGASAGGMLVGYAINERPELYKAVIARVPFVDVLNTMLDSNLPLTPFEFQEWGNPQESIEYFDYIKSYSPYENIKKQEYPHIFATTSTMDTRVGYWEPMKWIASIRENNTNKAKLFLLNVQTNSGGHFGHSNLQDAIIDHAQEICFILHTFNLTTHTKFGVIRNTKI